MENGALEIKTDSEMGSYDKVALYVYNAVSDKKGELAIQFAHPGDERGQRGFYISSCTDGLPSFGVEIPSEVDKVWRISMQIDEDVDFAIHCNDLVMVKGKFSEICKDDGYKSSLLGSAVKKVEFQVTDHASDYYRVYQGMPFLLV